VPLLEMLPHVDGFSRVSRGIDVWTFDLSPTKRLLVSPPAWREEQEALADFARNLPTRAPTLHADLRALVDGFAASQAAAPAQSRERSPAQKRFDAAWYSRADAATGDFTPIGVLLCGEGRVELRTFPAHTGFAAELNRGLAAAEVLSERSPEDLFRSALEQANGYTTELSPPFAATGTSLDAVAAELLAQLAARISRTSPP
jgi:hypothetical protein